MTLKAPTVGTDTSREKHNPGVHTINNVNPYQGLTVTKGHGKYPVIFEPLQNVQTSRSTYKVTSFIDFTPYLDYFQQFEAYLEAFKASIKAFENNPVLQEFREEIRVVPPGKTEEVCKDYPICSVQTIYYKLQMEQMRAYAERREQQRCVARHMQACLALKQFEYILNVTEYVNENYLRVKEKFLRAIDYVEDINISEPPTTDSTTRHKRNSENSFGIRMNPEESKYLTHLLTELAAWDPIHNNTHRDKRFISLFASIGAAIGSMINAGQIKKIKENIAILRDATILQDQQIKELARYADLTAARVRLHDTQIYRLQYKLLIVEDGIREMLDVTNFQIYTSYHVSIAQAILARLQTGSVSIENNIDKIFEYLRIMTKPQGHLGGDSPSSFKKIASPNRRPSARQPSFEVAL